MNCQCEVALRMSKPEPVTTLSELPEGGESAININKWGNLAISDPGLILLC